MRQFDLLFRADLNDVSSTCSGADNGARPARGQRRMPPLKLVVTSSAVLGIWIWRRVRMPKS